MLVVVMGGDTSVSAVGAGGKALGSGSAAVGSGSAAGSSLGLSFSTWGLLLGGGVGCAAPGMLTGLEHMGVSFVTLVAGRGKVASGDLGITGVYRRRNFLLRNVTLPDPSTLTTYWSN